VTRRARLVGGRPTFLRAAASAGALYPVEVYVVCGDLAGLPAGVYHFNPVEFALRRLRDGDHRPFLALAAADGAIERASTTLVLSGISWRTTWKYGERGYRHLFWDAGADELRIHLAPMLLGGGTLLFKPGTRQMYRQRDVRPSKNAVHLAYERV
jgi:SagB-type dehydrogenase family enzyme